MSGLPLYSRRRNALKAVVGSNKVQKLSIALMTNLCIKIQLHFRLKDPQFLTILPFRQAAAQFSSASPAPPVHYILKREKRRSALALRDKCHHFSLTSSLSYRNEPSLACLHAFAVDSSRAYYFCTRGARACAWCHLRATCCCRCRAHPTISNGDGGAAAQAEVAART